MASNISTSESAEKADSKKDQEMMTARPPRSVASTIKPSSKHRVENDDVLKRPLIIIIRHGKTEHNKLGLFTGMCCVLLLFFLLLYFTVVYLSTLFFPFLSFTLVYFTLVSFPLL